MEIRIIGADVPKSGTAVLFVGRGGELSEAAQRLDGESEGLIRRALEHAGAKKHGSCIDMFLPHGLQVDRLLLVVVGKDEGLKRLDLEELGSTIYQKLVAVKAGSAVLCSPEGLDLGCDGTDAVLAVAEGASLRDYRFTKYRRPEGEDEQPRVTRLDLAIEESESTRGGLHRLNATVGGVARARDLVSEPANVLYPESFAESCLDLEKLGLAVEILNAEHLAELKMNALLGVAQGSSRPPFVVVMRWQGGGEAPPVALVGKGVCFDTGGISLKPPQGMEDMKWDMAGAGAVVGAMHTIAARHAKANVVGVIGLVENMPSGSAQRPGDVVRAMSGKTIEVINTDAEGRLVLADVLWYTQDRFKPQSMVDLATLTGAIVVALGHEQAGLFSNNEELAAKLVAAGDVVGERLWRMPMGQAYDKHIKSDIAEIKNVGRAREAGATAGAVFLQNFVNDLPWAHLDIAGVAWTSRDLPLAGKGATSFGVRLLDRFVQGYEH